MHAHPAPEETGARLTQSDDVLRKMYDLIVGNHIATCGQVKIIEGIELKGTVAREPAFFSSSTYLPWGGNESNAVHGKVDTIGLYLLLQVNRALD
jgi:hypothetical protein